MATSTRSELSALFADTYTNETRGAKCRKVVEFIFGGSFYCSLQVAASRRGMVGGA